MREEGHLGGAGGNCLPLIWVLAWANLIYLKLAISEDNSALLCPWLNCRLSVFSCELIFWMIFSTISEGRPELLEPAYIRTSTL